MALTFYTNIQNKNYVKPKKSFWKSLFSEFEDFLDAPDVYLLYSISERKKLLSLMRGTCTRSDLVAGYIHATVNESRDIPTQLKDFVYILKLQGYDTNQIFFYKFIDDRRRICSYIYENEDILINHRAT
jgi:hypothetical protein